MNALLTTLSDLSLPVRRTDPTGNRAGSDQMEAVFSTTGQSDYFTIFYIVFVLSIQTVALKHPKSKKLTKRAAAVQQLSYSVR